MSRARLNVLGGFRLELSDREQAAPGPRKARALLGYLALTPRGASRDRLARLFWGDSTEAQARVSLRQCLSAVRRRLGPKAADWLVAEGDEVTLLGEQLEVDARILMRTRVDAPVAQLKLAIALYQGPLLDGLCPDEVAFEHWRLAEQQSIQEHIERLTEAGIAACRESGDDSGALRLALGLVNVDWTRQSAHRLVMECYARTGQLATARAHFRRFREQLESTLGVKPSAATIEVYSRLGDVASQAESSTQSATQHAGTGSENGGQTASQVLRGEASAARHKPSKSTGRRQTCAWFVQVAPSSLDDPESLQADLALLWEAATGVAENHGADEVYRDAEGLLALWGTARPRGNEAERAVRAASALHARAHGSDVVRNSRLGIASGLVVPGPDLTPPWIGGPLANARQLARAAAPGSIEMCAETRRSLPGGGPRAPLVGRDFELQQLRVWLDRIQGRGAGGTVVVRGTAGIGKTRLTETMADLAHQQNLSVVRVVAASSGEGDQRGLSRALAWRLVELLTKEQVGELAMEGEGASSDDEAALTLGSEYEARLRLLLGLQARTPEQASLAQDAPSRRAELQAEALVELLNEAVSHQPLICVFEDAHWADGEQLSELAETFERIRRLPILRLITVREEDQPQAGEWSNAVFRAGTTTLDLTPLDALHTRRLVTSLGVTNAEIADAVAARAGGNPLFAEQLARRAGDEPSSMEIPSTVRALVLGRLDRQAPELRGAVELAAVVGQRMRAGTVSSLLDTDCERQLRDEGWLELDGRDLRFCHALIRDAVYSAIHAGRRTELHQRVADHYQGSDPARHAEHLALAEDERAAEAFLAAAQNAVDTGELRSALGLAEQGRKQRNAPQSITSRLCALLGDLRRQLGDVDGALRDFEQAAKTATRRDEKLSALLGEAEALATRDRVQHAFARLDEASSLLAEQPDDLWMARIATLRGNLHFPSGDYDACSTAHGEALSLARRARNGRAEQRALSGLADSEFLRGNFARSRELFSQVIELGREHEFPRHELLARAMRSMIHVYELSLAQAEEEVLWCIERSGALGDQRGEMIARSASSVLAQVRGDVSTTIEEAQAALRIADKLGAKRFKPHLVANIARARIQRGESERAHQLVRAVRDECRGSSENFWLATCMASLALSAPTREERHEYLAIGLEATTKSPANAVIEYFVGALATYLNDGDWDRALELADLLQERFRGHPVPLATLASDRTRLVALEGKGESSPELDERRAAFVERTERLGVDDPLLALPAQA